MATSERPSFVVHWSEIERPDVGRAFDDIDEFF
ncbi:cupin, partial [Rhizobium leguminosarum]